MPSEDIYRVLDTILDPLRTTGLTEDIVEKLSHLFSDDLLLAALDLIDRECVIRYTTTWGHHHYHVHSSTATHTVFASLSQSPATPAFCTCAAFSKAILLMDSHIMCKHVLAVQLADRLEKFVEKQVGPDDFVALLRTEI